MTASFTNGYELETSLRAVREVLHGQLEPRVRESGRCSTQSRSRQTRSRPHDRPRFNHGCAHSRGRARARGRDGAHRVRRRQRRGGRAEPRHRDGPTVELHGSGAEHGRRAVVQDQSVGQHPRVNRCGTCHSVEGGQNPMFARSDDVNLAYAAANSVVTLTSPRRLADGHQGWRRPQLLAVEQRDVRAIS